MFHAEYCWPATARATVRPSRVQKLQRVLRDVAGQSEPRASRDIPRCEGRTSMVIDRHHSEQQKARQGDQSSKDASRPISASIVATGETKRSQRLLDRAFAFRPCAGSLDRIRPAALVGGVEVTSPLSGSRFMVWMPASAFCFLLFLRLISSKNSCGLHLQRHAAGCIRVAWRSWPSICRDSSPARPPHCRSRDRCEISCAGQFWSKMPPMGQP